MANKVQLPNIKQGISTRFSILSLREKGLLIGAIVAIILIGLYITVEFTAPLFAAQNKAINKLSGEIKTLPTILKNYSQLEARRKTIETQYDAGDASLDIPSYLEGLMTIADIEINKLVPREFGGKFEQTQYNIAFNSHDLKQIVEFLEKIIQGSQPLLITKFSINNLRSSRLRVSLELSSIRRKS